MRPFLPAIGEPDSYSTTSEKEGLQNLRPETINETQNSNEERNTRIAELLNKITSTDNDSSNSRMSDFTPPPQPTLNVKRDTTTVVQPDPAAKHRATSSIPQVTAKPLDYSNYMNVYEKKPYYASMGIGKGTGSGSSDKVLEKLNYMIHLLEQQQSEKTNYVLEECILYSLLGVFMIYVVDSFARSGKYTR